MSEPGANRRHQHEAQGRRTKGGYYLLNGSKMWITNGGRRHLVVYAKPNPSWAHAASRPS